MRIGNETEIKLILLRHGLTKSNEEHRYLGQTDEGLSDFGIKKLKEQILAGRYEALRTLSNKKIFFLSSPMKRCRESEELLRNAFSLREGPERKKEISSWIEMNFGKFEGKNYEELNGDPDYQAYIDSGGELAFPNGESREEFCRRVEEGWKEGAEWILRNPEWNAGLSLLHGGTIMALMSFWTGKNYFDFQKKNGEGYICRFKKEGEELKLQEWESI